MPTPAEVRSYVGASVTDEPFIAEKIAEAQAIITKYVGNTDVPHSVMESCVTQVAAELFHRRQAPNGIAQFSSLDGTPQRIANDPMSSVYKILGRYVTQGV